MKPLQKQHQEASLWMVDIHMEVPGPIMTMTVTLISMYPTIQGMIIFYIEIMETEHLTG